MRRKGFLGSLGVVAPADLGKSVRVGFFWGLFLVLMGDVVDQFSTFFFSRLGFFPAHSEELSELLSLGSDSSAFFAILLAVGVVAPFFEELFFRGFLHNRLEKLLGFEKGVLLSSFLFAASHLDVVVFPTVFLMGFFLAYAFSKTESILACFLMHAVNNTVGIVLLANGVSYLFPVLFR